MKNGAKTLARAALMTMLAFGLAACQTPIGPDHVYTRSDPKALIVFGLQYDVPMSEFQFSTYDESKGRMASVWTGAKKYDGMLLGYSRDLRFFADVWEPGSYLVTHYCFMSGTQTCVFFTPSLHFDVKPGRINYLGNFHLGYGDSGHTGYTDERVKAFLAGFPQVNADFSQVEMLPTPSRK